MAKYITKCFLVKDGGVVSPETEIELTKERATKLGAKVEPVVPTTSNDEDQKPLDKYTVKELKKKAEESGIDNYKDMRKQELIDALESE